MKYVFSFGLIVIALVVLYLVASGKADTWLKVLANTARVLNNPPGTGTSTPSSLSPSVGNVPTSPNQLQMPTLNLTSPLVNPFGSPVGTPSGLAVQ